MKNLGIILVLLILVIGIVPLDLYGVAVGDFIQLDPGGM